MYQPAGVCGLIGSTAFLLLTAMLPCIVQDRSMIPVMLCVSRLSGVGSDTLFIGVLRREVASPMTGSDEVKVTARHTTAVMLQGDTSHVCTALLLIVQRHMACCALLSYPGDHALTTSRAGCGAHSSGQQRVA